MLQRTLRCCSLGVTSKTARRTSRRTTLCRCCFDAFKRSFADPGRLCSISPLVLPSPNVSADGDWADAVNKARAYVEDLTVLELVNMTTG